MIQQYTLYDSDFIGNSNFETIVLEGIGAINFIDCESLFHWPPTSTDVSSQLDCVFVDEEVEYGCGLSSTDDNVVIQSTI